MLRYIAAAAALKACSLGPGGRAYRTVANTFGERRRIKRGVPPVAVLRANAFLAMIDRFGLVRQGARVLEVGTGWVHWYGLVLRLAYDVNLDMLDVVDNRQLRALRSHFDGALDRLDIPSGRRGPARACAAAIRAAPSFEALYEALGARYLLRPDGDLSGIADETYDGIFSFHVLEHIRREDVERTVESYYRIVKPGGFSMHQIGIDDHLAHYAPRAHPKQYLAFGDAVWHRVFENRVQYFNRLQRSQWLRIFRERGFDVRHVDQDVCSLEGLRVAAQYRALSEMDRACTILTMVHRKPEAGRRVG